MEKSNDKRITDIDTTVTRLAKMQGCVFGAVLNLHERSRLSRRRAAISTSALMSLESDSRHRDRVLAWAFGALGAQGLTLAAFALYFATSVSSAAVMSIVSQGLVLVLFLFAVLEHRQAKRSRAPIKETREATELIPEGEATLDHDLARIVALWNELSADDWAGGPKSQD